jgi:hypothetical protein
MERHVVVAPGYARTTFYHRDSNAKIFWQMLYHNTKQLATGALIFGAILGVLFI